MTPIQPKTLDTGDLGSNSGYTERLFDIYINKARGRESKTKQQLQLFN